MQPVNAMTKTDLTSNKQSVISMLKVAIIETANLSKLVWAYSNELVFV